MAIKRLALVIGVIVVPLLGSLGIWQLQRGAEKAELLAVMETAVVGYRLPQQQVTQPLRLELAGHLLPDRYFLLDNRTRDGRIGYEVLAVLALGDAPHKLLVNLGWVPAPARRSQLPPLKLPAELASYRGWLVAAEPGFRLGESISDGNTGWPQRVQQADWSELADRLGVPLYPAMLRVEQPYLAGADIRWQPVNMPPAKHYAYALQWFGLALMAGLWLWWWARKEGRPGNGGRGDG